MLCPLGSAVRLGRWLERPLAALELLESLQVGDVSGHFLRLFVSPPSTLLSFAEGFRDFGETSDGHQCPDQGVSLVRTRLPLVHEQFRVLLFGQNIPPGTFL